MFYCFIYCLMQCSLFYYIIIKTIYCGYYISKRSFSYTHFIVDMWITFMFIYHIVDKCNHVCCIFMYILLDIMSCLLYLCIIIICIV